MKRVADFRAFRDVGKRLDELHLGYGSVAPYSATIDPGGRHRGSVTDPAALYRVVKMKHPGSRKPKDLSSIIYDHNPATRNIPETAWRYGVNGKPALAWVMERQAVRTDTASGIVGDANEYALETIQEPRFFNGPGLIVVPLGRFLPSASVERTRNFQMTRPRLIGLVTSTRTIELMLLAACLSKKSASTEKAKQAALRS